MRRNLKRVWKWFTNERFSYLDLCLILIGIQILDWVLSHLTWR